MARPRLRYLLPAIALVVSACSGTIGTPPPSVAATVTGGASASTSTAPSSGPAAPSGSAASLGPAVASTAPASTSRTRPAPTVRATPAPATRPPATRPPATRPPATKPPATPRATQPPATPAPSATAVKIVDFGFSPDAVTVRIGTTVRWTNAGQADHTVTADAGAFDSGTLAPGVSFSFTFRTAGTFAYHCAIHPFMKGTITVTG